MPTTSKPKTLAARINAMKPGDTLDISQHGYVRVTAERSGDGKTLRFVRHDGDTSEVFRTEKF